MLTPEELREPDVTARITPEDYERLPRDARELVRLHLTRVDRVTGEWVAMLPAYRWRQIEAALRALRALPAARNGLLPG